MGAWHLLWHSPSFALLLLSRWSILCGSRDLGNRSVLSSSFSYVQKLDIALSID